MSLWNTERWHLFKVVFLISIAEPESRWVGIYNLYTRCQTVNRLEGNINCEEKLIIIIMLQVALCLLFTFILNVVYSQSYGKYFWNFRLIFRYCFIDPFHLLQKTMLKLRIFVFYYHSNIVLSCTKKYIYLFHGI